ncbi:MAG: phosphoenolpyruvate synthase [Candidatus Diapherotrites archaeon]|nr:phosphoenolpyruvate synthase [Candidatus Diapherotrites archaeon]
MERKDILWFKEITKNDLGIVGGKGLNLGLMTNANFPVPPGFVVTAQAYFHFLEKSGLKRKVINAIDAIDVENTKQLEEVAEQVRTWIKEAPIPEDIATAIKKSYAHLGEKRLAWISSSDEVYVAVRSSATAEDLPEASFAGQQETYLNVKGASEIVDTVRKCWASLFTARAVYYRKNQGFPTEQVGIAVVVQRMVESTASGVMFTAEPTGDETKIVIEAGFGLGEAVVSGSITPDHYVVDKKEIKLLEKKLNFQEWMIVRKGRGNAKVELSKKEGGKQKLDDEEILKLAKTGRSIESYYGKPQDIEFALENKQMYIVQSRAITTLGLKEKSEAIEERREQLKKIDAKVVLKGIAASPGVVSGKVRVVPNSKDVSKVQEGDILVTKMTSPDWVPTMKKSKAIITDDGGATCHAAIVSRELGIPCVVGTQTATELLEDNDIVTVNGFDGLVYEGKIEITAPKDYEAIRPIFEKKELDEFEEVLKEELADEIEKEEVQEEKVKTLPEIEEEIRRKVAAEMRDEIIDLARKEAEAIVKQYGEKPVGEMKDKEVEEETEKAVDLLGKISVKVKVNVALPEAADKAAETPAEGVGLLRAEHMITSTGKHPAEFIRQGKQEELTEAVKKGIKHVAELFKGKPVWFRTFDARSDEFRELEGGDKEPDEDNPMLGWHGIRRDLDEPEILKAQFYAIKQLLMEGFDNVGVMLPFVQSVEEVKQAKQIAEECGLKPREDLKFGVMIETPAACWTIHLLIEEGIDFISFGTNDLTQLTLGLDRNNEKIQKWFTELHPAILREIEHVIKECRKARVETSICGQAASNPEMVKHLVHFGIDSVSANIDAVEKIKNVVMRTQKEMVLEED